MQSALLQRWGASPGDPSSVLPFPSQDQGAARCPLEPSLFLFPVPSHGIPRVKRALWKSSSFNFYLPFLPNVCPPAIFWKQQMYAELPTTPLSYPAPRDGA